MSTLQVADAPATLKVTRTHSHAHPTVIILNMFYSGLGIARSLFGRNVRVVGLSADPRIYGNFTRLCEVRRAPNSQEQPEELADYLLHRCSNLEGSVLFPTRDADVLFLDRFRGELANKYILCIPSAPCLRNATDKYELALLAQAAGIAVPRTLRVDGPAGLGRVPSEIGFPCVLKPVSAHQWRVGDAWKKVGARKAIRVADWKTLQGEYESLSTVSSSILVQEWIEGPTDQIVVLGGYADANSDLLAYFTARKILQTPDDCGTGCVVRSEPLPELVAPAKRLLKSLQYSGVAEIEYKYDSAVKAYKLIEINTRHWDQHELGVASGVNLTWIAYCDLTHRSIPPVAPTVHATWIAEDALLTRLIRGVFNPELRIQRKNVWNAISSRRIYGIFATKDPLPFVRYFLFTILPHLAWVAFARAVNRARRAS
jgi:D-aspartate ligase